MEIGILGGSLNPIHNGHAILASYILQNCQLQQLWLMVSPQNPLKDDFNPALDAHRLAMARLVGDRLPGLVCSDFEFSLPRPSYTYLTLAKLKETYPQHNFHLIIGADNWLIFNKWKNYEQILSDFHVLVYPRPGYEIPKEDSHPNVKFIDAPVIDISSTAIRHAVAQGKKITFSVTSEVENYIYSHNLYKPSTE